MAAYTTIDNPELYFQIELWTGTGSENARTLDGDTNMQPDLVWTKSRSDTHTHMFWDAVRGATKRLESSNDDAESTAAQGVKSFDSDGFTLGTDNGVNESSETYVAWCWKESATAGFDMVSYTGNETARTISHSLSAVPHFMVFRNRTATNDWLTYHHKNTSAPETDYLYFNLTSATADSNIHFNDTAPTSSVFTVGTSGYTNGNTDGHIAYLFSEKQGFSKFGGYTGNGNADGAFIYTGFRPSMIIVKVTDTTGDWRIFDTTRDTYNVADAIVYPSAANAEGTETFADFLSNGFKIRSSSNSYNGSGNKYVYAAFAEAPFVNSNGVPCNAR